MRTATYPIVIPSYKNRVGNLVQHLEQVSDNKIYVFVYNDDYYNYKEYDCKPNVEFVKLNVNWRSIQKKRRYIQDYYGQRTSELGKFGAKFHSSTVPKLFLQN